MSNIDEFISDTVISGGMYLNLGLTLAAALAWSKTSEVFLKSTIGNKGPYLHPVILTLLAMVVFGLINRLQQKRIRELKKQGKIE